VYRKHSQLVNSLSLRSCTGLGVIDQKLQEVEVEVTLGLTVSQSVTMSWCQAPLWDLRPNITSCRYVSV
jgi:small ligand-binding sensory domain FIST